jgi:hypothetical protein
MSSADASRFRKVKVIETMSTTSPSVKVNTKTGDPIQLSDFHPVACQSLARLGSPNDGGYVVPLDAAVASNALLSFGLAHDWRFERDFRKHNPGAIIHCYDPTVSLLTAFQFSVGQLLRFVLRFKTRYLARTATWIDYMFFFRTNVVHFKQRIWRDRQENSATVDDAFAHLPSGSQVFAKVDIEGSEYRILDDLLRHSRNITCLAIEFHDVDIVTGLFNSLVEKIKRDFYIVHIHANNMGGMAPFHFPIAPEITFLNKRFFNSVPPPSRLEYPVSGLDTPNHPDFPDFSFQFLSPATERSPSLQSQQ